jgi:hypothetical protein
MNHEFTKGNLLSIITTLLTGLTIIVTLTLAYGELRASDQRHELRLARLEEQARISTADHDILIEIRGDVRRLAEKIEAMSPTRRAEAAPK